MNNQNLEVFNQIRSELTLLANEYKDFKINGINDVDGYNKAKEGAKKLRDAEIALEKLAKQEREGALNYQRGIISLEKDLLTITSPVKNDLKTQFETIDKEMARESRRVLLPDRIQALKDIEILVIEDDKEQIDLILEMDEKDWANYYSTQKLSYLENKDRIQREKQKEEDDKKAQAENEKIRIKNAVLINNNKILQAKADNDRRIAKEAQDIIDAEANRKADDLKRQADEEEDRKIRARGEKYQGFLRYCGMTNQTAKDEFYIKEDKQPDGSILVTAYKKVNSIII